jgi:hypothetical protein
MSHITDKQDAARAAAAARKKEDDEAAALIAKHFSTPEGRAVLELLCRRFGVLGRRFIANERGEVNAIKAGIRDGEASVILFIITCLAKSGEKSITLPLS